MQVMAESKFGSILGQTLWFKHPLFEGQPNDRPSCSRVIRVTFTSALGVDYHPPSYPQPLIKVVIIHISKMKRLYFVSS